MKRTQLFLSLLLLAMLSASAQQRLHLSVASFELEELDMDAQNHQKLDADGLPMALVKVTSTNPDDDLRAYSYNFGNLRHELDRYKDGELWIYVTRNAQHVSITRDGYTPVRRHDLGQTIQKGRVYSMVLSSETPKVYTQMVIFRVEPKNIQATVMVKSQKEGAQEEIFSDIEPATGEASKALPWGRYSYRVLSKDGRYHPAEGQFMLNDQKKNHVETVTLRRNFSDLTLKVDADADIYVNGEKRGRRSWTGQLKAGSYTVECRQTNHRPTTQNIQVGENDTRTITLTPPVPITGTLAVTSRPSGATIRIDGKDRGQTPQQLTDVLIGRHTVTLSRQGYKSETRNVEIKEGETTALEASLSNMAAMTIGSNPTGATLFIDGKQVGLTPYKAEMASGDYSLRITKTGYYDYSKRVHLDSSRPSTYYTLDRDKLSGSSFYLQAGYQMGNLTGIGIAAGAFFGRFNLELSMLYGMQKSSDVWWYYNNEPTVLCNYRPIDFNVKMGYRLFDWGRLHLTPQAGAGLLTISNTGQASSSGYAMTAGFGVMASYAIYKGLAAFVRPAYVIDFQKSDTFVQVEEIVSEPDKWCSGFSVQVGVSYYF